MEGDNYFEPGYLRVTRSKFLCCSCGARTVSRAFNRGILWNRKVLRGLREEWMAIMEMTEGSMGETLCLIFVVKPKTPR